MAHFAQIDDNNTVVQVVVVPDEHEHRGHEYMAIDLGLGGRWVKTSYNHRIRKKFAGIGDIFDEQRDAFIAPQPFESWILDEETCIWVAPSPMPDDGARYSWNENDLKWETIND